MGIFANEHIEKVIFAKLIFAKLNLEIKPSKLSFAKMSDIHTPKDVNKKLINCCIIISQG
jgi:hypothetical protein